MSATLPSAVDSHAGKAIGKNVVVKGQITSREDLIIEGEVEGTIEMVDHRLTIASTAKLQAKISARQVEVRGSVEGQVDAGDKVIVRNGAQFVGDIRSASMVVEDGAFLKGSVDLSRQAAKRVAGEPANLHAVAS